MARNEDLSDRKRSMQAYKDKLLSDVKYFDKRIEELKIKQTQAYYEDDSSDSDSSLHLPIKCGPSAHQLRAETSQLNLCLQATQELTSLQVLESEVNVLVTPPRIKEESPIEEGVWREALAECKVDLIPFSIFFYVFQPSKQFGCPRYYQLKVSPVKSAHERELAASILARVTKPSDAVQVLKSYSSASRSRRTTMAQLCDKFADAIVVEASGEGGYCIKCANVLEISWSLQNIWSPVMPFHHKLKFDLEYMDEQYIKTIKHAHKQLSDPSIETSERTHLLTKIINTCIDASGNISSITESETDHDQPAHLTPVKRRTTLEHEPEIPVKKRLLETDSREIGKQREIMAPPRDVPKKVKGRDKENVNLNRNDIEITRDNKGSTKAKDGSRDNQKDIGKSKFNVNNENNRVSEKHIDANLKKVSEAKRAKQNDINKDVLVNDKNAMKTQSDKKLSHIKENRDKEEAVKMGSIPQNDNLQKKRDKGVDNNDKIMRDKQKTISNNVKANENGNTNKHHNVKSNQRDDYNKDINKNDKINKKVDKKPSKDIAKQKKEEITKLKASSKVSGKTTDGIDKNSDQNDKVKEMTDKNFIPNSKKSEKNIKLHQNIPENQQKVSKSRLNTIEKESKKTKIDTNSLKQTATSSKKDVTKKLKSAVSDKPTIINLKTQTIEKKVDKRPSTTDNLNHQDKRSTIENANHKPDRNQDKNKTKKDMETFKKPINRLSSGGIKKTQASKSDIKTKIPMRFITKIPLSLEGRAGLPKTLLISNQTQPKAVKKMSTINEAKSKFVNPMKLTPRKPVTKPLERTSTIKSMGLPVRSSPRHIKKTVREIGSMFAF